MIRTGGDGRNIDCGYVSLGVWRTDCRHAVVECSDIGAVDAGILSPVKHGGVGAVCQVVDLECAQLRSIGTRGGIGRRLVERLLYRGVATVGCRHVCRVVAGRLFSAVEERILGKVSGNVHQCTVRESGVPKGSRVCRIRTVWYHCSHEGSRHDHVWYSCCFRTGDKSSIV